MRDSVRVEMAKVAEAVARQVCTQGNVFWMVEHEVRAVLPGIVNQHGPAMVAALAHDAVAAATPDPLQLQRAVEDGVRANLPALLGQEAGRLLPELARDAVAAATPDLAELRRQVSEHAESTVTTAVERETRKAIPDVVRQSSEDTVKSVASAIRREQHKARKAIRDAVREEVDKAFAEFAPNIVTVTLPAGHTVELGADSHAVLPDLLVALHARCHVLLVGPAGTGKSMLAKHAAQALGVQFQALSLGPTTPMSKVFGYFDAHGNYHDTPFRRAFEHGGVMLLDELDNGHPGLLAELNQALALGTCAFADRMVDAHEDFRLVATGNTYGTGADRQYVGRQALDSATLDRFVVIDVPIDEKLEERIALRHAPDTLDAVRELLARIRALRATVADKQLPVIVSPRASIDGAKLLQAGASVDQVMRWRVIRGLSTAHQRALGLDS